MIMNNEFLSILENNKVFKKYYIILNTFLTIIFFAILLIPYCFLFYGLIYYLSKKPFLTFILIFVGVIFIIIPFLIVLFLNKRFQNKIYNINNYSKIKKLSKIITTIFIIIAAISFIFLLIIIPITNIGDSYCIFSNCNNKTFLSSFFINLLSIFSFIRYVPILLIIVFINNCIVNKFFKNYNYEKEDINVYNNVSVNKNYNIDNASFSVGFILSVFMFIITFLPYYKCTLINDNGKLVHTYYYSFFTTLIGIFFIILVVIIFYILLNNYKIYYKGINHKPISYFWIFFNSLLLLFGSMFMAFYKGILIWQMNESGYRPNFSNTISYYLYPVFCIFLFIFSIISMIKTKKKNN